MENLIELFRDIQKFPSLKSGRIFSRGSIVKIESLWSQVDLTLNERTSSVQQLSFDRNSSSSLPGSVIAHSPVLFQAQKTVTSATGSLTAILRKCNQGKKSGGSPASAEPGQFVEVWNNDLGVKECSVDLKKADKHGTVHTDEIFGGLAWSHGEGHLCYLAERKPVAMSFFDPKFDPSDLENPEKTAGVGDEFLYKPTYGEQLTKVHSPVPCILDVPSGNISVLDNLPGFIDPTECIWAPDDSGLIFAGLDGTDRLGRIYCMNRKSTIYYYDLASASCSALSKPGGLAADSPRLSPDQKCLVWLERAVGGPHAKASRLMKCDWATKSISLVVDIVGRAKEPNGFPGLFATELPARPWLETGRALLITTIWNSNLAIIAIDMETGGISNLTKDRPGSWQFLDMHEGCVLACYSEPNAPFQLMTGRLSDANDSIEWQPLTDGRHGAMSHLTTDRFSWNVVQVDPVHESEDRDRIGYESIFCHPTSGDNWPLIVIPHGGPHGAHVTSFVNGTAFLCNLGFAVLKVNYRGSLGFGEDSINSLPGHVGDRDVKDVQHAVQELLQQDPRINSRKVCVYGGSHGGFLALHLIGQYPQFYKAAIARNPVINIAAMYSESDIPDWCLHEACGTEFDGARSLGSPEVLEKMWNVSPIRYVDQVETPVLFLLGAVDERVPPRHGLDYYHRLKARGRDVKMLWYPDNCHPIDAVDADADAMLNIARWLGEKLG